jgi:outer membrane immunogenic protein
MAASSSALAADLPSHRPSPVYATAPIFTWTGFYIGADIGYAWGYNNFAVTSPGLGVFGVPGFNKPNGEMGGLHVGYNYQINQFVVGLEGDVTAADFNNNSTLGGLLNVSTRVPVEGSIRSRVGYTWDRALFFVTGGAVFGDIENNYGLIIPGVGNFGDPAGTYKKTRVGYTVGGGVEYALSDNWSVRGEYRYSDFGHSTDNIFPIFSAVIPTTSVRDKVVEHRVTVGFSYKFEMYAPPAPVLPKY